MNFLINPLLAKNHFVANDAFPQALRELISCLKYVTPLLNKRKATVLYDDAIELFEHSDARPFLSFLGNLSDRDLKRQWFLYTRNRCVLASGPLCMSTVISDCENVVSGMAHVDGLYQCAHLFSFRGNAQFEEKIITIGLQDKQIQYQNFAHSSCLKDFLPRYEASDKHGMDEYVRSGGKVVAPMRLAQEEALKLLLASEERGHRRVARGKDAFYVFVRTHHHLNVYHGYEVNEAEYRRINGG